MFILLFWERVNPSLPSTSRPCRLRVLEFTAPFVSFHLEDLHCCSFFSASCLPIKLLGLPVSASQSISVLSEVVRIQISSDRLGEYLLGG